MGFFDKLRTGAPSVGSRVKWLSNVNEIYVRAFQTKNANDLPKYFTRICTVRIMERIRMGEKAFSGLSRYQNIKWMPGPSVPNGEVWIKELTYDNIKMSHGIHIPVGDATKEEWHLIFENNEPKVNEIRRC